MINCQIEYTTNKKPRTLRSRRYSDIDSDIDSEKASNRDRVFTGLSRLGGILHNSPPENGEWFLENVLQMVLDTLDPMLENILHALSKKSSSNSEENQWAVAHNQLLKTIQPKLEKISKLISSSSASTKAFNNEVISALRDETTNNNPFLIMKILTQFTAPWIKHMTFVVDDKAQENLVRLLDMNYPPELIPQDSLKSLMTTNHPNNDLFIKKVEYLYFAYNENGRYNHLYHDEAVNTLLYDTSESYNDFCTKVNHNATNKSHFVFFDKKAEAAGIFPSKLILDLFAKSQLRTLKPTSSDFEIVIRRMAAAADVTGLSLLLNSPVLDVVHVKVHAKNSKEQAAIDLINEYQKKYPALSEQYSQCHALLESFQPQHVLGKRSDRGFI